MQQKLTFDGNSRPLRGVYTLSPSQEYIRKLLFTAVLVDDEVVIDHVKSSPGLERVLEALQFLGVHVEWISEHSIAVDARKLGTIALPKGMLSNLPLYWFAFAALLARNGRAAVPFEEFIDTNGGLSKRISRLFTELGVELTHEKGYLIGTLPANWKEPRTVTVSLPFPYKEETEILLLLSATRNNVQTVVRNASSDNIVEYLEKGLRDGGAHIERHLHATLIIDGIDTLNSINVATPPDVFEAGLVALFTAAAGGEVEIRHTEREGLLALLTKLTNMGIEYRFAGDSLRIWSDRRAQLKPVGVKTGLFPKFSSRWIGPLAVLMSQAKGES